MLRHVARGHQLLGHTRLRVAGGNRLTIVFGVPGGSSAQRPIELKTSKDNPNVVLFVLERVMNDSASFHGPPNQPLQPTSGEKIRIE